MKKAYSSVFIVIILGAFVSALVVIFDAASAYSAGSISESLCKSVGNSLLAEYDVNLYEKYGILAFSADSAKLTNKASHYIESSTNAKGSVVKLKLDRFQLNYDGFEASDPKLMKKQLVTLGLSSGIPPFEDAYIMKNFSYHGKSKTNMVDINEITDTNKISENEVEYILYGHKTDRANLSAARLEIYGIRYAKHFAGYAPADAYSAAAAAAASAVDAELDVSKIMKGGDVDGKYADYLRGFLLLELNYKKMDRVQDVMEMNLKREYNDNFDFSAAAFGFNLTAEFSHRNRHGTVTQTHGYY